MEERTVVHFSLWTPHPKPQPASSAQEQTQNLPDYNQYKAYSQLLDRNGQWISAADTKAGAALAFLVALFPIFAAPALSLIQKTGQALPQHIAILEFIGLLTLLLCFFMAALVTLLSVLMALLPRLTHQVKPGLIYFGDIVKQDANQWQQRLLALDPHQLSLEVLEQVYATASIAEQKHQHVHQAIRALIVTLLFGFLLYVFSQIML